MPSQSGSVTPSESGFSVQSGKPRIGSCASPWKSRSVLQLDSPGAGRITGGAKRRDSESTVKPVLNGTSAIGSTLCVDGSLTMPAALSASLCR